MQTPSEFFVRRHGPEKGSCFVLMPFEDGMSAVYEHGIKPLVESLGMQCRRADELYSAQGIMEDVWASMQTAEIIVADLTGKNPNVMYELGLCHALWKRVILLSQNKDDVPFDLRAWRVIWYDFTFAGSARLKEELTRAIELLRSDTVIESQIVPFSSSQRTAVRATVGHGAPSGEAPWLFGVVETWKEDEGFGFIRVGDEDFYFNPTYLFDASMAVERGLRAVFKPLEPLSEGKNRRAEQVFIHGSTLEGVMTGVVMDRGFGFADIEGQNGQRHNLFVLLHHHDDPISPGVRVRFEIAQNKNGPIGNDVVAIDKPASVESPPPAP